MSVIKSVEPSINEFLTNNSKKIIKFKYIYVPMYKNINFFYLEICFE